MKISFSKEFKKNYKKLSKRIQIQCLDRIKIFIKDQNNPQLNNHKLHGKYDHLYSINISGDTRVIYERLDKNKVLFIKIGTHSQLY